jgi:hypothetical protein
MGKEITGGRSDLGGGLCRSLGGTPGEGDGGPVT